MGKQGVSERAEVEAPTKKSKKEKALVDTVAEVVEPEMPKNDKKSKRQKAETGETAQDKLQSEAHKKTKRNEKNEQGKAEAEEVEAEAPKKEKRKRNKDVEGQGEEPEAPGVEDADKEKRKRKGEKTKRKQAASEQAAGAEEKAEEKAPKKKTKTAAAAAAAAAADEDAAEAKAPKKQTASSESASVSKLTVRVGGLSLTCTEEALCKDFSECGEIESLKVPGKKKSRGIAFITYTCKRDVEKALKLDASDYEGCTLRVNLSGKEATEKGDKEGNCNGKDSSALQIFVGGLPVEPNEAALRQHFGECGKIASFRMPLSARNCPKGIAIITYKTQAGAEKALAFDGKDYGGRILKVSKGDVGVALKADQTPEKRFKEKSIEGESSSKGKGQGSNALKMFVGGLPLEADETTLRETFGECGEIASFKRIVPSNPEKKGGIAFITFKTQKGFDKALLFDGTDYEGCTLRLKHAGEGKTKVTDSKQKGKGKDGKGKGKVGKSKGKGKVGKSKGKGKGQKGK